MHGSPDWSAIRAEFPALAGKTYLNTVTFGQLPRRASEAMIAHLAHRDELACSDFLSWFDDADRIRESLARLIDCTPADIAFVPNASTALSLLVSGLDWKPGDRVVTLADEFPNIIYNSALLPKRGVERVEVEWEGFYDALTPATRLVAVTEVNYTNGFRPPLAEIARRAHELGALLFVDGTQSLGALQFDVNTVQPDMYALHGYKWLLSPTGAGFMYVAPELRSQLEPAVVGWRSDRGWRNVAALHHGAPQFTEDAEKYEGAMLSFPLLYAMGASVQMMLEIGPGVIERRVMELAGRTREVLRRLGAFQPSDASPWFESPVLAARFEGRDASALARELKERGVLISARHGNLRISTHFYNDEGDIERLEKELRKLL